MYAFVYRRIIMRELIQTKPKPTKQNKQTTQKRITVSATCTNHYVSHCIYAIFENCHSGVYLSPSLFVIYEKMLVTTV